MVEATARSTSLHASVSGNGLRIDSTSTLLQLLRRLKKVCFAGSRREATHPSNSRWSSMRPCSPLMPRATAPAVIARDLRGAARRRTPASCQCVRSVPPLVAARGVRSGSRSSHAFALDCGFVRPRGWRTVCGQRPAALSGQQARLRRAQSEVGQFMRAP